MLVTPGPAGGGGWRATAGHRGMAQRPSHRRAPGTHEGCCGEGKPAATHAAEPTGERTASIAAPLARRTAQTLSSGTCTSIIPLVTRTG